MSNHTHKPELTGTLEEIVRRPWKSQAYTPVVARHFLDRKDLLKGTADALADMGFRRFSYLANGGWALVLNTTDNQVVRLEPYLPEERDKRESHPVILQPICSDVITIDEGKKKYKLIVEVLPKVRMDGVTDEHRSMVYEALRNSGYSAEDTYSEGNVGLIEVDGKLIPVLIDPGDVYKVGQGRKDDEHLRPWLAENGTWLQYHAEPRIRPSNVITGKSVAKLDGIMDENSQTMKAIKEDGLYQSELGGVYERAIAKFNNDENPHASFSDALKEERALLKGKAPQNLP